MTNTFLLFTLSNFLRPLRIVTEVWFCYEEMTKNLIDIDAKAASVV